MAVLYFTKMKNEAILAQEEIMKKNRVSAKFE